MTRQKALKDDSQYSLDRLEALLHHVRPINGVAFQMRKKVLHCIASDHEFKRATEFNHEFPRLFAVSLFGVYVSRWSPVSSLHVLLSKESHLQTTPTLNYEPKFGGLARREKTHFGGRLGRRWKKAACFALETVPPRESGPSRNSRSLAGLVNLLVATSATGGKRQTRPQHSIYVLHPKHHEEAPNNKNTVLHI